jgi:hypothetical protein
MTIIPPTMIQKPRRFASAVLVAIGNFSDGDLGSGFDPSRGRQRPGQRPAATGDR